MSFDISVGGVAIPTDTTALKSFQDDLNFAFSLDTKLTNLLDTALCAVPASAATSAVSYTSPAASWTPAGGPVTFGLSGGASGTLAIVSSGTLLSYTDGLDTQTTINVPVPAQTAYVVLTLKFNLSGNAAAKYSGGAYGVTAAASTADSSSIAFYKAFPCTTTVRAALAAVFEGFVLPLHPQTLTQMAEGDYLLYDFDGNQHLSFGAYAGIDQVLYAGQSSADVANILKSPLATLSAGTKPTIQAGATLAYSLQYATRFEALLSKLSGVARLHLFRSASTVQSGKLQAGLTFDGNTTASMTSHVDTIAASAVAAAGGAGSPAGAAVAQVLGSAQTEIAKYVAEVNDKLTAWLNRANGLQANLEVDIESTKTSTLLAGYDFDLASAHLDAAWKAAIDGDFVAALGTGAVTLDVGTGLEQAYQRRTTFSCNFFNLWSVSTWSQFSTSASVVYAGNNVFHVQTKVNRTQQTTSLGALRAIDVYFTINASMKTSGGLTGAEADLHLDLTAQDDPKGAATIATMLSAIEAGAETDALARAMHAFSNNAKQGTAQLKITLSPKAYGMINCDEYVNGKPATQSTYNDAVNYAAFAQAADDLNAWPLTGQALSNVALYKSYSGWQALNLAETGGSTANRMQTGDAAIWPDTFPQVGTGEQALIGYSMRAAGAYMNFCQALRDLATASDTAGAGTTWNQFVAMVTSAIKDDLNVDFLRPAALATLRLTKAPATIVDAPSPNAPPTEHFAVTLAL